MVPASRAISTLLDRSPPATYYFVRPRSLAVCERAESHPRRGPLRVCRSEAPGEAGSGIDSCHLNRSISSPTRLPAGARLRLACRTCRRPVELQEPRSRSAPARWICARGWPEPVTPGTERVVLAGGDGSIHHAIQELAGSDTALALIPSRTSRRKRSRGIDRSRRRLRLGPPTGIGRQGSVVSTWAVSRHGRRPVSLPSTVAPASIAWRRGSPTSNACSAVLSATRWPQPSNWRASVRPTLTSTSTAASGARREWP